MSSRDKVLLMTLIDTIDEINSFIKKERCTNISDFKSNTMLKRAVTMCLVSISEMVDTISDDFKNVHPDINFKRFNIAAHKYGAVNFDIIWEIADKNMPVYRAQFAQILEENRF